MSQYNIPVLVKYCAQFVSCKCMVTNYVWHILGTDAIGLRGTDEIQPWYDLGPKETNTQLMELALWTSWCRGEAPIDSVDDQRFLWRRRAIFCLLNSEFDITQKPGYFWRFQYVLAAIVIPFLTIVTIVAVFSLRPTPSRDPPWTRGDSSTHRRELLLEKPGELEAPRTRQDPDAWGVQRRQPRHLGYVDSFFLILPGHQIDEVFLPQWKLTKSTGSMRNG